MSEKRTLSRWLRTENVYRDESAAPPDRSWRNTLLADFEHSVPAERKAVAPEARAPLQWHHLVLMAPAGVVLFGLGWIFGSDTTVVAQANKVPPMAWAAFAITSSAVFMIRRGMEMKRRR